jgi:FKBP-type peptidyl-prolyl cis-trans isomerase FkpA
MKTTIVRLLALLVMAAGPAACDSPNEPAPPTGPANLVVTDLRVGTGATLAVGQVGTFDYALWLYDPAGTDSKGTRVNSTTPLNLQIANGAIIAGWVQGLPGMKVGGIRRLVVPPSLAYGPVGSPPDIPGNSWIVFDIELLAIVQ